MQNTSNLLFLMLGRGGGGGGEGGDVGGKAERESPSPEGDQRGGRQLMEK